MKAGEIVRDHYRKQGADAERERIIKLLEEQAQFALDNGDALRSDADMRGYQLAVKHSLQLIKGENK